MAARVLLLLCVWCMLQGGVLGQLRFERPGKHNLIVTLAVTIVSELIPQQAVAVTLLPDKHAAACMLTAVQDGPSLVYSWSSLAAGLGAAQRSCCHSTQSIVYMHQQAHS
jgi:hypothetical protein